MSTDFFRRWLALLCCMLGAYGTNYAQSSLLEDLARLSNSDEIKSFYHGLFNEVGLHLVEDSMAFTIRHVDSAMLFSPGIDPETVDFTLEVTRENMQNLQAYSSDGHYTSYEATRITAILFSPFAQKSLMDKVLRNNTNRKDIGIEDIMHISLLFEDSTVARSYTLLYVPDQWLVVDGLHGAPERRFILTYEPALELQRTLIKATATGNSYSWDDYFEWYSSWRDRYAVE